ncbi:MAG: tetratricopeptide repeat protein [Allosphingosinicella sp.]|uniref:SPOR domain-containing protein n=1 Tax=Allosphingosinicella sp. TaxID=2823234 RepID=UPI00392836DC
MKSIAFKFAASSIALSMAVVGCQVQGVSFGTSTAFASQARGDGEAGRLAREAGDALGRGDLARALEAMEQAVALSPRDAGYRLTLADIYMRSGRFESAEATYRDVLALDPSRPRAGIALALMQAANGRSQDALAQLESLQGQASPSDLGLAYALAGSPQRAVDILEPVARSMGATARVRQNLALAYALGGDWSRARMIASQDVSPAELSQRMTEWASMASQPGSRNPVVAVLGVNPVADAGQPVRLALNAPAAPVSAPVQMAEAAPIVLPPVEQAAVPAPAPVAVPVPAATPVEAPAYAELEQPEWGIDSRGAVQLPAPVPAAEQVPVRVQYAAAAETLVRPDPVVMPVSQRPARRSGRIVEAMSTPSVAAPVRSGSGRYVVQIGAYSNAANAERAWQDAERRFGLASEQPVTMTFDHNGRLLHRVAISGFTSRADANRQCASIRSRGGECFVRGNAGDAAIRWAARYGRNA